MFPIKKFSTKDLGHTINFLVKEAPLSVLLLVSLLFLPIILNGWEELLKKLDIFGSFKYLILFTIFLIYCFSLVSILRERKQNEIFLKYDSAKKKILKYLQEKGWTLISFKRIKYDIDMEYTDEFLSSLVEKFPHFSETKVVGGNKAIKYIKIQQEVETN